MMPHLRNLLELARNATFRVLGKDVQRIFSYQRDSAIKSLEGTSERRCWVQRAAVHH